jgi:peroxiredoxin
MQRFLTTCACAIALLAMCCSGQAAATADSASQPKKPAPPKIAPVLLSKQDESYCRARVGGQMPDISLPQLGGKGEMKLAGKYGKKATVVVFWKTDRRMSVQELADMNADVIKHYGPTNVAVVGVAVKESDASAQAALKKSGGDFPNLLDASGEAFAQVGSQKLPRIYLLDPQGKILWFDIEYSVATRRELKQALRVVAGEPVAATGK